MKRNTFAVKFLLLCLLTILVALACDAQRIPVKQVLGWFDVKNYGAVGDSTTNDNTAIQAAINAAYAAGGSQIVYFPNGRYRVSGALQTSVNGTNPNAQLYIPLSDTTTGMHSITLLGESPPSFANSGLINYPINQGGVIIESTIRGSGTKPCILGSPWYNSGFSNLNSTDVSIVNMNFRNRSKVSGVDTANTMCGINLDVIGIVPHFENVRVDIQSNIFRSTQPAAGTIGILFPGVGNSALVRANNVFVSGYDTAMFINEHFDGGTITVSGNNDGIYSVSMAHAAHITRLLSQWNKRSIVLDGAAYLKVDEYDCEQYTGAFGAKWYTYQYDVYKKSGIPKIDITYWTLTSGSTPPGNWTTNMTTGINASMIGGINGPAYIANTFGSTNAQSNSEFIVSGNAIVGGKLGIGLTQLEQKSSVHARSSIDTRITTERTGGSYLSILSGSSASALHFDKTKNLIFQRGDSIADVSGGVINSFIMFGTTGNAQFGTISAVNAQLAAVNTTASQPAFKAFGASSQTGSIAEFLDNSAAVLAKIGKTGGIFGKDTLQVTIGTKVIDTTTYKPVVINSTGDMYKTSWLSGGGGSGITTLNTLTASTQSFAFDATGTTPGVTSTTSTHTFHFPLAGSGITAGLVSGSSQTFAGVKTFGSGSGIARFKAVDYAGNGSITSGSLIGTGTGVGDIWLFSDVDNATSGNKAGIGFWKSGGGGGSAFEVTNGTNRATLMASGGETFVAGSVRNAYVAKTANYTATSSDHTIECTANSFQVTLPTAVGIAGTVYEVVNSGAGTITIGTTSAQTFVNVLATPTSLTVTGIGATTVRSNGANWMKISGL